MKTYFAKYLPVEGEIKDGDVVREDHTNRLAIHLSFGSDTGMSMLKYLDDDSINCSDMFKKVKLFLCSRDIKVGDILRIRMYNGDLDWEAEFVEVDFENHYKCKFIDRDGLFGVHSDGALKVIGEISPDATWVKEGDEFDEENLCCFIADGFNSGSQKHVLPFTTENGQHKLYVGIKGPCGHFH